jgi:poly-gamma-glutamate biosynthesis protein PgsC/CapC
MTLVLGLGAGLTASLVLAETLSIAPGGYIVPGYVALSLNEPGRVAATIGVAIATLLLMRMVEHFVILYGMRRFVLYLLTGFTIGVLYAALVAQGTREPIEAIGFVVPGLLASWMDRQGVMVTLGSMFAVAVIARLVILILGKA